MFACSRWLGLVWFGGGRGVCVYVVFGFGLGGLVGCFLACTLNTLSFYQNLNFELLL